MYTFVCLHVSDGGVGGGGMKGWMEKKGGLNYCFLSDYLFSHLQELHLFSQSPSRLLAMVIC